jgi:citrate lyase subunit beta/citryl-CoA lyase
VRSARSLLYVPANRHKMLEKAVSLPADAFILDLEDGVPASEKQGARATAKAYAERISGERAWIRVNSRSSGLMADDMRGTIDA